MPYNVHEKINKKNIDGNLGYFKGGPYLVEVINNWKCKEMVKAPEWTAEYTWKITPELNKKTWRMARWNEICKKLSLYKDQHLETGLKQQKGN